MISSSGIDADSRAGGSWQNAAAGHSGAAKQAASRQWLRLAANARRLCPESNLIESPPLPVATFRIHRLGSCEIRLSSVTWGGGRSRVTPEPTGNRESLDLLHAISTSYSWRDFRFREKLLPRRITAQAWLTGESGDEESGTGTLHHAEPGLRRL
jgi:hypothetical protein